MQLDKEKKMSGIDLAEKIAKKAEAFLGIDRLVG